MPQVEATHSVKPFDVNAALEVTQGTLPFTVVIATTDGQQLWSGPEQALWQNMMRAIGFAADEQPTFIALKNEAADDMPLPANHEATLQQAVYTKLADQPIIVMGHRALQVLSKGQANAASVRRGDWSLEKASEKGCFFPLVATYHVHTLLRQPFLKRQTWADLLAFKQMLDAGSE